MKSSEPSNNRASGPLPGWRAEPDKARKALSFAEVGTFASEGRSTIEALASVALTHPHQKPFYGSAGISLAWFRTSGSCLLFQVGTDGRACEVQSADLEQLQSFEQSSNLYSNLCASCRPL